MRILKNIRRKVASYERAEEKHDVETMILNQLSEEEQAFIKAQAALDEDAPQEDHNETVLQDIPIDKLLEMYRDFRN
jgi:hypothetical protein